jgi:proteasome lid subunit RPN8/RPN11
MESTAWALTDAARRTMLEHANREAPLECCGLLLGSPRCVVEVVPARNELRSPTRFLIDSSDHFAAIRLARERGLEIVGAYHSHPSSAPIPSPTDRDEAWEAFLYVIVSLTLPSDGEQVRGWQLVDGNFHEVQLVREGEEVSDQPCVRPSPSHS